MCKCFVLPGSHPALLGMPGIQPLGVITIKYETIARQLTPDDNPDKRQRNCQSERAVETEDGKPVKCTKNRQDVDPQKAAKQKMGSLSTLQNKRQDDNVQTKYNADNISKPNVTPNAMVTGKYTNKNSFPSGPINDDDKSFFSELIINDN